MQAENILLYFIKHMPLNSWYLAFSLCQISFVMDLFILNIYKLSIKQKRQNYSKMYILMFVLYHIFVFFSWIYRVKLKKFEAFTSIEIKLVLFNDILGLHYNDLLVLAVAVMWFLLREMQQKTLCCLLYFCEILLFFSWAIHLENL